MPCLELDDFIDEFETDVLFEEIKRRRLSKEQKEYMERFDINERRLKNGDVIDLHQTVNGQNLFVVFTIEPLDIRYAHDVTRKYEYDKEEMLSPSRFTGEVDWEIVNNIYLLMLGAGGCRRKAK